MTATALDGHRETNSQERLLRDLTEQVAASGVKYVYYQVVTLTGRVLAKVVPAEHLRRNLERGVQFHRTAVSDLQADRHGELLGGGAAAAEFTAMPDADTFRVLPWDPSVGRFLCRLYEPSHVPVRGGEPLATDPRGNLFRLHDAFTAATGLRLKSGCEPEMTWLGPSLEVKVRPGASPAYHAGNLELMRPIYQKLIDYAQAMGLDMIEGDYEDAGQLELNWMYDSCELTADRLITYRQICQQVAREFGVTASFMPKPTTGSMGNGCHHNLSLWHGDENILEEAGRRELHLTERGRHALGGLLTHVPGSMAVMASTVNSYKRFWDAGQFAPSRVNWGLDNKTCTVRLSSNGRLEYKLPDASVNPYLSHAALLAAMQDGLERELDPGEPQTSSSYDDGGSPAEEALPLTLGDALAAFERDKVVRSAFPEELATLFGRLKADEWARSCGAVTDWDREMYLEYLP
ncbi:glutamine synthetase family protein [Streptomyces ossamyceticus]|uniref:glutamine synthetase family protein n=1 Tax=Streptomyces ossamyceticus TaxID=249581 RepID=UPI0006E3F630|nr:glutamine synthetase [Streptomyces ossamyceticus]